MWAAEPEYQLEPRCRCLSCWEATGLWMVDSPSSDGHFVIGSESEARALADYLNALEKNELALPHP